MQRKWFPYLVTAAIGLFAVAAYSASPAGEVSERAHQAVEQGALLLDVRTPQEFAAGHIEGAVNVPVQVLDQRLAELGPKDRTIVVYCRSGSRSALATKKLLAAGHREVIDLGPMSAW